MIKSYGIYSDRLPFIYPAVNLIIITIIDKLQIIISSSKCVITITINCNDYGNN